MASWQQTVRFIGRSSKRLAIALVGAALITLGLALLPLPGPWTLPPIIGGLAILATEFAWAERLLDRAKAKARAARDRAKAARSVRRNRQPG